MGQIHKATPRLLHHKIRANSAKNSASNTQSGHRCKKQWSICRVRPGLCQTHWDILSHFEQNDTPFYTDMPHSKQRRIHKSLRSLTCKHHQPKPGAVSFIKMFLASERLSPPCRVGDQVCVYWKISHHTYNVFINNWNIDKLHAPLTRWDQWVICS